MRTRCTTAKQKAKQDLVRAEAGAELQGQIEAVAGLYAPACWTGSLEPRYLSRFPPRLSSQCGRSSAVDEKLDGPRRDSRSSCSCTAVKNDGPRVRPNLQQA
jgi:hypothetical protein